MTYSIRKYQEIPAREGVAFHGEILRDGAKIGTVSNDGNGGCNSYHFPVRADHAALFEAAKLAMPDEADYPEVHDLFVSDLITVALMNRLRSHAFRADGDGVGVYRTISAKYAVELCRANFRTHNATKNPQYWDKIVSAWIPA